MLTKIVASSAVSFTKQKINAPSFEQTARTKKRACSPTFPYIIAV